MAVAWPCTVVCQCAGDCQPPCPPGPHCLVVLLPTHMFSMVPYTQALPATLPPSRHTLSLYGCTVVSLLAGGWPPSGAQGSCRFFGMACDIRTVTTAHMQPWRAERHCSCCDPWVLVCSRWQCGQWLGTPRQLHAPGRLWPIEHPGHAAAAKALTVLQH